MVFPVVMFGCESWTIKKAEGWRIDALELWWWKTLESPLDSKEIKPVNEGLTLKLKFQYFGYLTQEPTHCKIPSCWERFKQKEKSSAENDYIVRWLDSMTIAMDMDMSKLLETVEDRGEWYAVVYGVVKSLTWQWQNDAYILFSDRITLFTIFFNHLWTALFPIFWFLFFLAFPKSWGFQSPVFKTYITYALWSILKVFFLLKLRAIIFIDIIFMFNYNSVFVFTFIWLLLIICYENVCHLYMMLSVTSLHCWVCLWFFW